MLSTDRDIEENPDRQVFDEFIVGVKGRNEMHSVVAMVTTEACAVNLLSFDMKLALQR